MVVHIIGKLVTFMDGDSVYAQTVAGTVLNGNEYASGGGKITIPTLTRDGYQFTGWYKDSNCTEKWDFTKTDGENDTSFNMTGRPSTDYGTYTLYAGWYEIEDHDHVCEGGTARIVASISLIKTARIVLN